jgi:hypothetical protein
MRTREYRARMSRFRTPLGTSESSLTATRRRRPRRRCQQRRRARDWCADRRHRLNSMGSVTVKTMARFGRASWSGVVRARLVGRAEHSTMAAAVRRVPASIVCGVELAKPRLPVWPYENGTGASPCARPFSEDPRRDRSRTRRIAKRSSGVSYPSAECLFAVALLLREWLARFKHCPDARRKPGTVG